MRTYRLALIGFGNVGQGFAQILRDQGAELSRQFDIDLKIVAVSDPLKGNAGPPFVEQSVFENRNTVIRRDVVEISAG